MVLIRVIFENPSSLNPGNRLNYLSKRQYPSNIQILTILVYSKKHKYSNIFKTGLKSMAYRRFVVQFS